MAKAKNNDNNGRIDQQKLANIKKPNNRQKKTQKVFVDKVKQGE